MSNYVVNDIKRYKENRRRGDGTGAEITIPVKGSSLSRDQRAQKCQKNQGFQKGSQQLLGDVESTPRPSVIMVFTAIIFPWTFVK